MIQIEDVSCFCPLRAVHFGIRYLLYFQWQGVWEKIHGTKLKFSAIYFSIEVNPLQAELFLF